MEVYKVIEGNLENIKRTQVGEFATLDEAIDYAKYRNKRNGGYFYYIEHIIDGKCIEKFRENYSTNEWYNF